MDKNYKNLIITELDEFDNKKDIRLLIKIYVIIKRFKKWRN